MIWIVAIIAYLVGFLAAWVISNLNKKEPNKMNWGE